MSATFRQRLASRYLSNGVIAHPTDTIYGLACLANNPVAINQIIHLKRRSHKKGLILLASDIHYILPYIDSTFESDLIEATNQTSDRPTTFIVPADLNAPDALTGGSTFVAVRITNNKLIRLLCERSTSALVSTSANISGHQTASKLLQLRRYFKDGLSFTLTPLPYNNQPSRIIHLLTGEQIR